MSLRIAKRERKAYEVARDWHGGQSSKAYSYLSTGAIQKGLIEDLFYKLPLDPEEFKAFEQVNKLLGKKRPRGPVEGWSYYHQVLSERG